MTLIYLSRPAPETSAADILDIWAESLEYNELHEMSGALFFGGEMFLHVLEGEEDVVEPLFEKIKKDRRHQDITVLSITDVATVMFRNTPMKLVDGSRSRALKAKFNYEVLRSEGRKAADKAAFNLWRL